MSDAVDTNSEALTQPVYQTDIGGPALERDSVLPRDTAAPARDDVAGSVAAAVAKLRGVTHTAGAPRDEQGRFAARDTASTEDVEDEKHPTGDNPDAQPGQPTQAAGPPPDWSDESKAAFSQLPATVQADIAKWTREKDTNFQQMSAQRAAWSEVDAVMAPRRQAFGSNGFRSDAQVINHLLSYADAMDRNPAATLKTLAESYGLDLSAVVGRPAAQEEEFVAPEVAELRRQNAALMQRVQSIEGTFARQSQESVQAEISRFAADKPHFDRVRPVMGALLSSGVAKDLDDAYQRAVYADPEARAALLAEQAAKAKTGDDAQRKAVTSQQRRAAVQVKGGSPASTPAPAPKPPASPYHNDREDIRGDVLNAMRQLAAR